MHCNRPEHETFAFMALIKPPWLTVVTRRLFTLGETRRAGADAAEQIAAIGKSQAVIEFKIVQANDNVLPMTINSDANSGGSDLGAKVDLFPFFNTLPH